MKVPSYPEPRFAVLMQLALLQTRFRSPFSTGLVICILAAFGAGCSKQPASAAASAGPPPAPVKVASAQLRNLPVEIKAIGNVEAFTTISVKSQLGGTIMKVRFTEGSPVKKGDLLFEIDPRPYQ